MACSILRYYYFAEDDREVLDKVCSGLESSGFNRGSQWAFLPEDEAKYVGLINHRNMLVLVVGCKHPEEPWAAQLSHLAQCEKDAGLKSSDLLAQITVLSSSPDSWNHALEEVRKIFASAEPVFFETASGQLARLNWKWPQGHAHYLFTFEESDPIMDRFFTTGLPVIEASLIRLNLISNMYRDRSQTILAEKQTCDKRLASILHTQLVFQSASRKEIDEMEAQINELSSSYGILVGDYSLVAESKNSLRDLIDESLRQLKSQQFLILNQDLLDTMLNPYRSHLASLSNMESDLRSSWENHQAAISVVRSRIDIMISRENIETQSQIKNLMETNTAIQEQSLTFQVAAGIIEFIVLAYYSHSLWKSLAHNAYALVPPWAQFITVLLFSGLTVEATHLFAEYRQGHRQAKGKLILFSVVLIVLLVLIIGASALMEAQPAH